MSRPITKGATDQSTVIRIVDSADGTPETGVTSATSGLDLKYRREGAAAVSLTESDLAAVDSAHSDGGIIHIGGGYYRVDLPDAAVASGANGVLVFGTVTGMVVIAAYHQLTGVDQYDAVRGGMTALPNAAADAPGGLPISDAGGLDLDAKIGALTYGTANRVNVQVYGVESNAITAASIAADAGTEIGTAVWASATRTLTALDEDSTTLDIDTTIRQALGLTDNNLDTRLTVLEEAAYLLRTTIASLSSQTSFTLTDGSTDNDAYNGCVIVVKDASASTQKAIGVVSDYTGSSKTVTLLTDPAVFTMAASDVVTILACRALKPTTDNRTLDVTATGAAGIDWANVENPTGSSPDTNAVAVSGSATGAEGLATAGNAYTNEGGINVALWRGSQPNALQSGRMDSYIGATASALAFNLTGNVTGSLSGSVGSVTAITTSSGSVSVYDFTTAAKALLQTEANDALVAYGAATSAEVTAIQNNTRVVLVVPNVIERPDSGTTTYRVELLLYDTTGNMEAPDSAPTLALVDQGGTDLSARLDSATGSLVSTGRYRWIYTASATDDLEQLVWTFSVVEGGATRLYGNTSLIVDTTAVDFTSADRTKLEAVYNKLPSKSYLTGTTNSDGDIQADEATGNFPGSVGSVAAITTSSGSVSVYDFTTAAKALLQTEANDALVANNLDHLVLSAVDTDFATTVHVDSVIGQLAQTADGGFSRATDSLEAIRNNMGTAQTGDTYALAAGANGFAAIKTDTAAILIDTNELQADWTNGGRLDTILDASAAQFTTQMTESYNADGVAPTPAQALFVCMQRLTEFSTSGNTITVKRLNGSSTAYTLTLDSASTPTGTTRAT